MSKTLQEQMKVVSHEVFNEDAHWGSGMYSVVELKKAVKVAEIYALEQQIKVLQELGRVMLFNNVADKYPELVSATTGAIVELQDKLKALQGGK